MTVDPHAGRKLRLLVDKLASEYSSVEGSKSAAIVDTFVTDETASKDVQDIVGDIVFRFLFAGAQQFVALLTTNSSSEAFDSALDHFISTKTRLTGDLAKRLRQNLVAIREGCL